jgi:hypothetical protein
MGADFKRDWERLRGGVGGHGLDSALQLAAKSDAHAAEQAQRLLQVGLPEKLQSVIQSQLPALQASVTAINDGSASGAR